MCPADNEVPQSVSVVRCVQLSAVAVNIKDKQDGDHNEVDVRPTTGYWWAVSIHSCCRPSEPAYCYCSVGRKSDVNCRRSSPFLFFSLTMNLIPHTTGLCFWHLLNVWISVLHCTLTTDYHIVNSRVVCSDVSQTTYTRPRPTPPRSGVEATRDPDQQPRTTTPAVTATQINQTVDRNSYNTARQRGIQTNCHM